MNMRNIVLDTNSLIIAISAKNDSEAQYDKVNGEMGDGNLNKT